jgi:hypothetical protein
VVGGFIPYSIAMDEIRVTFYNWMLEQGMMKLMTSGRYQGKSCQTVSHISKKEIWVVQGSLIFANLGSRKSSHQNLSTRLEYQRKDLPCVEIVHADIIKINTENVSDTYPSAV